MTKPRKKLVAAVDFARYRGRYVAIVDDKVIATGRDARIVWSKAKKKMPSSVPTLVKVPTGETLVLFLK